jgi:hypothetical protein
LLHINLEGEQHQQRREREREGEGDRQAGRQTREGDPWPPSSMAEKEEGNLDAVLKEAVDLV